MKITNKVLPFLIVTFSQYLQAQDVISPDLACIPNGKGWKGDITAATLSTNDGSRSIEFKPAQGRPNLIWLDSFSLTNGVIEFDVRGRSTPASSFVGVAFRIADAATYDAVYFRPFNYRATNAVNRAHAVQYMSHPAFPWNRLREEKPGQYENGIEPAPDGDAWVHARIVLERPKVSVFVNGSTKASLSVDELSDRLGGSVGLWCGGFGAVANLKITPKN